jgi:hypothetical protein
VYFVWVLQEQEQSVVVPKFGKYRVIASSDSDTHLEQIKVEKLEETEGIRWSVIFPELLYFPKYFVDHRDPH